MRIPSLMKSYNENVLRTHDAIINNPPQLELGGVSQTFDPDYHNRIIHNENAEIQSRQVLCPEINISTSTKLLETKTRTTYINIRASLSEIVVEH